MRILTLRFKNLNSLTGEWHINFTDPAYENTGIFAITGATGAGKSTILDALCLALYGQTPRLGRISKSTNEIMSRQHGECFAEIEFVTSKGSYRCRWGQHRSRKKPTGELQNPQHEIVDAENDKVITHKIREVLITVEQVSGMNFDRFTRSMLLAQGSFAAFLQAKPDERAPLLEQITGTRIYSDISKKVHEYKAQASTQLQQLEAHIKGIQLLSEEEKTSKKSALKHYKSTTKTLRSDKAIIDKGIQWQQTLIELENQLAPLKEQQLAYQQRYDNAQAQRTRLQHALEAEQLADEYQQLLHARQQNEQDQQLQSQYKQQQAQLTTDYQQQQQHLNDTQQQYQQHQQEERQLQKILIKVRELDTRIHTLDIQRQQAEQKQQDYNKKQQQLTTEQQQLTATKETLHNDQQRNQKYLQQHPEDAALVEQLASITLQLEQLQKQYEKSQHSQQALTKIEKQYQAHDKKLSKAQQQYDHSATLLKQHQEGYQTLEQQFSQHLAQQSLTQWRQEQLVREKQYNQWHVLETSLKEALQLNNTIEQLQTTQQSEQQQLSHFKKQQTQQQQTVELQNRLIDELSEKYSLQRTLQSLEQHRTMLVDQQPCPLCGALEHPYHKGELPINDVSQQQIEHEKTTLNQYQQQQQGTIKQCSQTEAKLKHISQQLDDKQARLNSINTDIIDTIETIDSLKQQTLPEQLQQQLTFCQQQQQKLHTDNQRLAEKIQHAEKLEQQIKQQQKQYDKAKDQQQQHQQTLQKHQHQQQLLQTEIKRLQDECQQHTQQEKQLSQQLNSVLQPYAIALHDTPTQQPTHISQQLKERQQRWKTAYEKQHTLEKQQQTLEQQQTELTTKGIHLQEQQQENDKNYTNIQQQLAELSQQRYQSFANKDPEQEAKRYQQQGKAIQRDYETLHTQVIKLEHQQQALQAQQQQLKQDIITHQQQCNEAQVLFNQKISKSSFADETNYLHACVSKTTLQQLQQQQEALKEEKIRIDTLEKNLTKRYQDEKQRQVTDQSLTALQEKAQQLEQELSDIERDIGAIHEQLSTDKALRQTQATQLELIAAQQKEVTRWANLHNLIGSADGKKFRNFAQGLTFEIMIVHANQQLKKMNDRYLLKHNGTAPLELNIIDNYQASEERSIKNLSGGESFIVSLALALGLSQMASQQISIDSLFLDEGFGTLDEETLETALEALAKLHQDNKLIGVISHVASLKQRIPTQIHLTPNHQGHSQLSGPGVKAIQS